MMSMLVVIVVSPIIVRHCEEPEATRQSIFGWLPLDGLPRRFAPRNDGVTS
jgi:hypothetical protein